MKQLILLIIIIFSTSKSSCQDLKQLYSEEFNWRMNVPEGFTTVTKEKSAELDAKGKIALEKTLGQTIENNSIDIFRVQLDKQNYFQANYQPHDEKLNPDYLGNLSLLHKTIYQTFITQIPGVEIDSSTTTEYISKIKFVTYKMSMNIQNKATLNMYMFSSLFGKKDLTVSIVFLNEKAGRELLEAWRKSTFN